MIFTDLDTAFEEMIWLTETTGKTHCVYHGAKLGTYRVSQSTLHRPLGRLVAELNSRNLIGERLINLSKGQKLSRVIGKDQ